MVFSTGPGFSNKSTLKRHMITKKQISAFIHIFAYIARNWQCLHRIAMKTDSKSTSSILIAERKWIFAEIVIGVQRRLPVIRQVLEEGPSGGASCHVGYLAALINPNGGAGIRSDGLKTASSHGKGVVERVSTSTTQLLTYTGFGVNQQAANPYFNSDFNQ